MRNLIKHSLLLVKTAVILLILLGATISTLTAIIVTELSLNTMESSARLSESLIQCEAKITALQTKLNYEK